MALKFTGDPNEPDVFVLKEAVRDTEYRLWFAGTRFRFLPDGGHQLVDAKDAQFLPSHSKGRIRLDL